MSQNLHSVLETEHKQSLDLGATSPNGEACTFPLSLMQESLWFFDQITPGSGAYNIPEAWRLKGKLDICALKTALDELTKRHESLRTVFKALEGDPEQIVLPAMPVDFAVTDLGGREDKEAELRRLLAEEARRPFDLERGPLARVRLFQLANEEHLMALNLHHIISDAWSFSVFLEELASLYSAHNVEETSPLPELPIQYGDFAVWQRELLEGEVIQQHLAYWKDRLKGELPALNLPVDHPRPASESYRGATRFVRLERELTEQLKELSRGQGVTLFITLLAAFKVLLHRYTHQTDIIVGSLFSGRERVETEKLIGFFVNTQALRTDLSGDPSFLELLRRVREVALGAADHQNVPLEIVLRTLQPEGQPGHHALFRVVFGFQPALSREWSLPGLKASRIDLDNGGAKFDLTLLATDDAEGMRLRCEYNTDLFEAGTIKRLLQHFETLLKSITDNPQQRLSELPLLTEVERKQLVEVWNATQKEYPKQKCIHELFEEQAAKSPQAAALVCGRQSLTYRELNERAQQAANYLKELGVRAEALVAICLERSWEMVAGMLGIMKAGAAYVPMDPAYPKERLAFMLEDTNVAVLLTQRKLLPMIPQTQARIVCVEDIFKRSEECPPSAVANLRRSSADRLLRRTGRVASDADNKSRNTERGTPNTSPLAYVIYTSGSTGQPKGVALEHRGAVALACWAREVFTPQELSGVLASTSICFDLSVFELFVPLSWGGRVILADNALALGNLAAAKEVSLINTVPSAIRELLRLKAVPASVRVVNLAGEPLSRELVEQIYSQTRVEKVYDLYGPTETTTYSTCALRRAGEPATIGRPLANEQVYVLDSHRQPVPMGVAGEIYIGGDGLARGYLNRPELTAERFVSNPFRGGERLYRTGDLGRWREDGNLEYLGRLDHQVKIRGYRIELGEVESALKQHTGVRDAVVMAREGAAGEKRLVGYVVAAEVRSPKSEGRRKAEERGNRGRGLSESSPMAVSVAELREFLEGRLPGYMVPSAFVFLQELPLTPNGKIDRKALPEAERDRGASGAEFAKAQTPIEEQLVSIWSKVLHLKHIGIRDNFFEIGGDSLLAIQVISRIRETLKIELPLSSLFDAPTIEELGDGLACGRWKQKRREMAPIERIPGEKNLPVSFVQERLWFLDQLDPASHAYNVPAALRLKGVLNVTALQKAFDELIRRHETLRTTFCYQEGKLSQNIEPNRSLEIELEDLTNGSRGEVRALELVNAVAQQPFDLAQGPLIRAKLLLVQPEEHIFVVVMHHTISDGWSLAIFLRELQTFYESLIKAASGPDLPDLPVRFADYAHWRRQSMKGPALEEELSFWKEKLAGAPARLELPADRTEPDDPARHAARRTLLLSPEQTQAILEFGQRESATPFIVLMSALAITLHKWSKQQDLVIGTVVSGRNRPELENLIGCFMNFLPIRARINGGETGQAFLTSMRSAILEAQTHQGCPFEKMVEAINPERRLHQNPLYNVALLYQNFPAQVFEIEGVETSPVPVAMSAALLDLRFEAEQTSKGLSVGCEYKSQLFEAATIDLLLASFQTVLDTLMKEPAGAVDQFALIPALTEQGKRAAERNRKQKIALAATFTAEPIEEPLRYWLKQFGSPAGIEFAPYNQVFQQLLDPGSLLGRNESGLNVLLVRPEDWCEEGNGAPAASEWQAKIRANCEEFLGVLKAAAGRSAAPYLVRLCPPGLASARHRNDGRAEFLAEMEERLLRSLETMSGVCLLTSGELNKWYPVPDYEDTSANELGRVPYTPIFFTSLGTAVARKFHALNRRPYKVIVLDCDQTLWSGVCGEDGAKGIRVDEPRRTLQEFMRAQQAAGMLLALCSKNNQEDVWDVFEQRLDMPLRREHFCAWRLNWQPKSHNLKGIADELGLGLDSFIFIDDNPVECAEVAANCPEVMTLELPGDCGKIARFLDHCWVFDRLKVTEEDRRRGEMYQQNQQRESLREKSMSLGDFIAGLQLNIQILTMTPEQLPRVAQLTQRTNQFNFTTRRRTESDLKVLAQEILAVSVQDRFGDYGLVGVMICEPRGNALEVDTFLLSCRVLGRGVEHQMLARLGELARKRGLNWVDAHFQASARNKPASDFLESIAGSFNQPLNGGSVFRIPSEFAAEITFNPLTGETSEDRGPKTERRRSETGSDSLPSSMGTRHPTPLPYRRIAIEADDIFKIHKAMESRSGSRPGQSGAYVPPRKELERKLCELWQRLLHLDRVGIRDNFFELGGHSLLAVRLFAEIEKVVGRKLPLVTLFQAPTIEQLAQVIGLGASGGSSLLVPLQPRGSRPPLWLIHGAGGDVLWGYANLAVHLPANQPVYGIKSRGQAGLEEFTRLEQMAEGYLQEIRSFQPQGPYLLGGYCFGGNVAYEMARQLQAQGEEVKLVALIDAAPANAGYESMAWWRPAYAYRFARNAYFWLRDFEQVAPKERRRFFWRKVRVLNRRLMRTLWPQLGLTPVDLEEVIDPGRVPEKEQKLWEIHLRCLVEHVQQPFEGAVTLLRTRGQAMFCSLEDDFCWGRLARGGVNIVPIPGSHENIFMEPHVKYLAKELEACLATMHTTDKHHSTTPPPQSLNV